MTNKVIIITACLVVMVLVIGGLITNQIGVAMTGTAILGALLGAAGVKYQPQLQLALCKIGFHKWERSIDGNWVNKWCKKCYTTKRRRIV